jgi:opacity protein-like surface antigen
MSRKKYAFITFVLLTSSVSWAGNGFYAGAGVGSEATDYKQTARVIVAVPPRVESNIKDTEHFSGTGVFANLFGGYSHTWRNQLYLAGEINLDASTDEFTAENVEFVHATVSNTSYKMENAYGVSLLPGYAYKDFLYYARVGYANGNLKTASSDPSLANINRRIGGLRLGLGINKSFTDHINARVEYSETFYQKTRFKVINGPATKTTQITPTTGQVEISVIYNFGKVI